MTPQDRGDDVGRLIGWATILALVLWILALVFSVEASDGYNKGTGTNQATVVLLVDKTADRWAQRDVATKCADSEVEWTQIQADAGLAPPPVGTYRYGFSFPKGGRLFFSPVVCFELSDAKTVGFNGWKRRPGWVSLVAWSADVLIHESFHARLRDPNEAQAEACAKKYLPVMLHETFGLRYHRELIATLTRQAALTRASQPPDYRGGTCPQ